MSTAINFGKVRIYNEQLPSIKSHDHLIRWSGDFDLSYTIFRFRMQTPRSSPTDCSPCSSFSLQPFRSIREFCAKNYFTNQQAVNTTQLFVAVENFFLVFCCSDQVTAKGNSLETT